MNSFYFELLLFGLCFWCQLVCSDLIKIDLETILPNILIIIIIIKTNTIIFTTFLQLLQLSFVNESVTQFLHSSLKTRF